MTSSFRRPLMAAASGGILALLSIYVLIGTPLAPFHGDESMHVWSSEDSDMLTGLGPWSLTVSPPYVVDSPQHFRLATGSIYKHWLGLIRRLAGLGQDVLPPAPGWDWASDYKTNEAMGHVPRPELLAVARLSAVLLSALAIWPASLIGRAVAGRPGALLYPMFLFLNSAVLLNGRRAMQESALLLFGLLAIWAAFHLAGCLSTKQRHQAVSWMFFSAATGLALAAKHSGVIFAAGAFAVVIVASLRMGGIAALRGNVRALVLSAAAGMMVFFLLSPALWNRPWERVVDVVSVRTQLLEACSDPEDSALPQRIQRVLTMPFLEPTQYFELLSWRDTPGIAESIRSYEASGLAGLPRRGLVGWALTACVAAGVVFSLRSSEGDSAMDVMPKSQSFQPPVYPAVGVGAAATDRHVTEVVSGPLSQRALPRTTVAKTHKCGDVAIWRCSALAWWVVSWLFLLANPLPVQRYYLPLIASSALLAVLGVVGCLQLATTMFCSSSASRRPEQIRS